MTLVFKFTKNIAVGLSCNYFCLCNGFSIIEIGFTKDIVEFALLGFHIGINFNISEYQES